MNQPMGSTFDLHGYVTISVEAGAPAERQLREMFRPFLVAELSGPADIVVGSPGAPLVHPSHGEHAFRFTEESVDVVADRVRVTVHRGPPEWPQRVAAFSSAGRAA